MKKIILLVSILFAFSQIFAQTDSLPIYKRFPSIPPFSIVKLPDSLPFTKDDLSKKKATIIMVFSPDCDHCQHATEDLIANMNLFKNVQIVMATPMEYKYINGFYHRYQISKYPNIKMGRDVSYFFGTFYSIRNYPSIFLYDKKGNFKESFEGSISFKKIASFL